MATCKECFYYKHCGGFLPSDLDKDVWHYCTEGRADEIPDVDKRCTSFKDKSAFVPKRKYDRLQKELDAAITIAKSYKKELDSANERTVEIIRCRDCKLWEEYENTAGSGYCHCKKFQFHYGPRMDRIFNPITGPDEYCSFAERKDENGKV